MNVTTTHPPDNTEKFREQCDVRAYLWACGLYGHDDGSLARAVDYLEDLRVRTKLPADAAQLIMARAFASVRDDLGGWVP